MQGRESGARRNPINALVQSGRNLNRFNRRKSTIAKLIDVALLMANVSQLKTIQDAGPAHKRFHVTLTLIISSIVLQLIFAVVELALNRIGNYCEICNEEITKVIQENTYEANGNVTNSTADLIETRGRNARESHVEFGIKQTVSCPRHSRIRGNLKLISTILVLFIIISNVFITGFGLSN